jgi:Ras-related protein Rab-2A
MNFEYHFKYIVIGDSGVGKSCIIMQFINNTFDENKENTVGVEYGNKAIEIGGMNIKLQIWDTAGQEQFKSITRSYYRAVAGALVVFDVTNELSFLHIKNWLEEARNNANNQLVVLLCGNKIDSKGARVVTKERAAKLASENGIPYIECSALSRINIDEIFRDIAERILDKIEHGEIDVHNEDSGVRKMGDNSMAENKRKKLAADRDKDRRSKEEDGNCC